MKLCALSVVVSTGLAATLSANPIRKVVNILQKMQQETEEEGRKQEKLFDKFMCYCKTNKKVQSDALTAANSKIEELKGVVASSTAEKSQLTTEIGTHKEEKSQGEQELKQAAELNKKETAQFTASLAELDSNIQALGKALKTLSDAKNTEKQQKSSLIQRQKHMRTITALLTSPDNMFRSVDDDDRQKVLAFYQNGDGSTDMILGILQQMKDDMEDDKTELKKNQKSSMKTYQQIKAAKTKEVAASAAAIESKSKRAGELAMKLVVGKNDLDDSNGQAKDATKYLKQLTEACEEKSKAWEQIKKMRVDEQKALGEAIEVLNDDDALEVFNKKMKQDYGKKSEKKAASFLQLKSSVDAAAVASRVLDRVQSEHGQPMASLLQAMLGVRAPDFSKILKMIEEMKSVLTQEQKNDEEKKKWCDGEFDTTGDKIGANKKKIKGLRAEVDEGKSAIQAANNDVVNFEKEIKQLDTATALATAQRQAENQEYINSQQEFATCKSLLEKAKNRLNKFYQPSLYKEAPKPQLTDEEQIVKNLSIMEEEEDAAPPEAPDFGSYEKKQGGGVVGLMNKLIAGVVADQTTSKNEEVTAQKEYERIIAQGKKSRQQLADSITDKKSATAKLETKMNDDSTKLKTELKTAAELKEYKQGLHSSCDFIVQNFTLRKEARANELDGLDQAKAVLSGANYK